MRKVLLLSAIVCVIAFVSCFKKTPQDGFVEFSVEGRKHHIENREFMIRVNPALWEGEKVKMISKGSKNLFEFGIGPTEEVRKKELEAMDKDKRLENLYIFDAMWVAETTDPEGILKSKITFENPGLGLTHIAFNILVPGRSVKNPQERIHSCWIEIGEITEDRVRGRFGGPFVMNLLGKEADEKFAMHQRGEISKETLMSEIEKTIQINDGVFDVPYRKLFKYE
jgi:hypothetical protein